MPDHEHFVAALQEEEEEGGAPSLCDLPLTSAIGEQIKIRRQESFEFLTPNLNSSSSNDLVWPVFFSTANEHLIFSEQLQNLKSTPPSSTSVSRSIKTRRFEISNESKIATRSSSIRHDLMPNRSNRMNHDQFPSDRANRGYSGAQRRSQPWYWPAQGNSRYSPAAEIKLRNGAKIRQHGSPTTWFPAAEKASCERSTRRLINALSCKSHGSVAVTTPVHPYC